MRKTLTLVTLAITMALTSVTSVFAYDTQFFDNNDITFYNPDVGCTDTTPVAGGCGTANFRAATYNIERGGPTNGQSKGIIDSKFDIVGLQEVDKALQNSMMNELPDNYQTFPQVKSGANNTPVIWNTDTFTKVDSGTSRMVHNTLGIIDNSWVALKASNGMVVYATSIHMPRPNYAKRKPGESEGAAWVRVYAEGMELLKKWKKDVVGDNMALVMGDFNDGPGVSNDVGDGRDLLPNPIKRATYCDLTKQGDFQQSYDMAKGISPDKQCPSLNQLGGELDQLYVSPLEGVTASNYTERPDFGSSDHRPVSVDFKIVGQDCGGAAAASSSKGDSTTYKNAVYNDSAPDPATVQDDDGLYHVFATGNVHLTSKDLVNWKKVASGWNMKGAPNEAGGARWGADVVKLGSKYVLTYTIPTGAPEIGGGSGGKPSIAYATADSPSGPFTYGGKLPVTGSFNIGSKILVDGDKAYIYWGGGYFNVREVELSGNTLKLVGPLHQLLTRAGVGSPGATIESPWVYKRGDWYYMMYSQGHWQLGNDTDRYPYQVAVTRSKSPTGGFEPNNTMRILLKGNNTYKNPGSNSTITDSAGNDWLVYHSYVAGDSKTRKLMIDPITYENDWPTIKNNTPSSGGAGPTTTGVVATQGTCTCDDPSLPVSETILEGKDNPEKIWNWLTAKGMTDIGAAGIMGNMQVESGFNPFRYQTTVGSNEDFESLTASAAGGKAFGLVQWDGTRRQNVLNYIAEQEQDYVKHVTYENGKDAESYKNAPPEVNDGFIIFELDFLHKEATPGGERGTTWKALMNAKSATDAADIFEEIFEGSSRGGGGPHVAAANSILKKYSGSTGTSAPGNPGCRTSGNESLGEGGLTEEQAKTFVKNYGANRSGDSAKYAGALWPFCSGGGANCVTFSYFFNNKFTDLPAEPNDGNGENIVDSLRSKGAKTGNTPKVYSTFSWDNDTYGHTGIVLGIHGDQVIVGHASCGSGSPGIGDGTSLGLGAAIIRVGKASDPNTWLGKVPNEFAYPDKVDTKGIEDYVNGKV